MFANPMFEHVENAHRGRRRKDRILAFEFVAIVAEAADARRRVDDGGGGGGGRSHRRRRLFALRRNVARIAGGRGGDGERRRRRRRAAPAKRTRIVLGTRTYVNTRVPYRYATANRLFPVPSDRFLDRRDDE